MSTCLHFIFWFGMFGELCFITFKQLNFTTRGAKWVCLNFPGAVCQQPYFHTWGDSTEESGYWVKVTVVNQGAMVSLGVCGGQLVGTGTKGQSMGKIVNSLTPPPTHTESIMLYVLFGGVLFLINNHALHWVLLSRFWQLTLESHCRPRLICEMMLVILSRQCFQTSWGAKWSFTAYLSDANSGLKYGWAIDTCKIFLNPYCRGLETMLLS